MEARFERDLKPYAEPIAASELQEGSVYFFVNFIDREMLIPTIETVVYVGKNLEPNDENQVYFQDIESFRNGIRYGSGEGAVFETGSADELGHVFEYERALDVLMACSLRRQKAGRQ